MYILFFSKSSESDVSSTFNEFLKLNSLLQNCRADLDRKISTQSIEISNEVFQNFKSNPQLFNEDYLGNVEQLKSDLFMVRNYVRGVMKLDVDEVYYVEQIMSKIKSYVQSNFDEFLRQSQIDDLLICISALNALYSQSEMLDFICTKLRTFLDTKCEYFTKSGNSNNLHSKSSAMLATTTSEAKSQISLLNYLFQNVRLLSSILAKSDLHGNSNHFVSI